MIEAVKSLIDKSAKVSILTHLNPDADTLGTALGIYGMLKTYGKQVEIVSPSKDLPISLDFLPHFSRIKNRMNFDDSLVISCDTGSIDRLHFDLENRDIINIDHHKSNTKYGQINVINPIAASASQVAFELFKETFTLSPESVTCFYTALVSDTQFFSTNNVSKEVFSVASEMIAYGVNIQEVLLNLKSRNSLASLRILSSTLDTLELEEDARLVLMVSTRQKMLEAGASLIDTQGIINHGITLATAEIAVLLIELEGMVRVSLRSKKVDVTGVAVAFGGGGHKYAAGFEVKNIKIEELLIMIKREINKKGLLNEKK